MARIFTTILNMSLTASIIILIVLLVRLCLKKAPKIYSYLLWAVVLFRLLCPVSFSLPVSVLAPVSEASTTAGISYTASMEYISVPERPSTTPSQHEHGLGENTTPVDGDTAPVVTDTPDTVAPQQAAKKPAGEIALTILGWLWATGMAGVLGFTTWQTLALKLKLDTAFLIRGNIFESEKIDTAFILGVFNPKIYLPLNLPFDIQKAVVAHEQTHQRRGDHIVKLVSYIALAVHWFNPLVWLSFKLMCDDMEKSCDEAVIRSMNDRGYSMNSTKKAYGNMLLVLGGGRQHIFSPVSFAENSTKSRVKNVVAYNRIARNTGVCLAAACVLVALLCAVNPAKASAADGSGADMMKIDDVSFSSDVTYLDLSGRKIDDFSLITKCPQLVSLNISNTGVTDLSFLSSLTELQYLDISGNHDYSTEYSEIYGYDHESIFQTLRNEEVLGTLTNLRSLNISDTAIKNISFVSTLTALEELNISGNFISDFSSLSANTNLKKLDLASNYPWLDEPVPDAVFPHGLTALEELDVRHSTFSDLSGLADCRNLRVFLPPDNFTDLYLLSGMSLLESLELQQPDNVYELVDTDNVLDLRALSGMSNLKKLIINTPDMYFDLSLLEPLNSLEYLHVGNCLRNDDGCEFLSNMKNLRHLEIASYDLSGMENLSSLEELQLTGAGDIAPLAGCKNLKRLVLTADCEDISALSGLKKLISLDLSVEKVTDLSGLSALTNLTYLNVVSNGISDLSSLSALSNLTELRIVGDNITDLSGLSTLTNLTNLQLFGKNITDLSGLNTLANLTSICVRCDSLPNLNGLETLTELTFLDVRNCNIQDISALSSLHKLEYIGLDENNISDISSLFELGKDRAEEESSADNLPTVYLIGNPLTDAQVIELYEKLNKKVMISWMDDSIFD